MPLAYHSVGTSSTAFSGSLTFSFTVAAVTDRCLTVGAGFNGGTGSAVSGITYAGAAMSLGVAKDHSGSNIHSALYYKTAPTTGANNVVITLVGSSSSLDGGAILLEGANQASPLGNTATSEDVYDVTVNISTAGSMIVSIESNLWGDVTSYDTGTKRWDSGLGNGSGATGGPYGSTGNQSIAASYIPSPNIFAAIEIKEASGSPTSKVMIIS